MNLKQIKIESAKEQPSTVKEFIEIINKAKMHYGPSVDAEPAVYGSDVKIPAILMDEVEKECDNQKIPAYRITSETLSVAETYTKLSDREKNR